MGLLRMLDLIKQDFGGYLIIKDGKPAVYEAAANRMQKEGYAKSEI